ncbi:alpha/beta hydrolase-fold protein [Nocardioides sp. GY 10127]|uniref:alpha/beta hydrolase-fold protein n=1 Tax=Nocardioides sp. GY 10127 TaxID=2569762 RepID=UPI0010A8B908|nr:alpha/beta hydrolase-fold protein [Nocardioides sp. GY 10127]TIC86612.1 hypothetical protein E8D37_01620 [Nocardioides sp. GY 10127]
MSLVQSLSTRRVAVTAACLLGAAAAVSPLVTTTSADAAASSTSAKTTHTLAPTVRHTGKGPTGYVVTFRVKAPDAENVKIKGTWTFASDLSTSTDQTNSSPISAATWTAGDFPLQSPNGPGEAWAVADMTLNPGNGVWRYTVPLPSGTFDYQFYVDCTAEGTSTSGCTSEPDPANPAYNTDGDTVLGHAAVFSQVYVPSDSRFGTEDRSWEADAAVSKQGSLAEVEIPTSTDNIASGIDSTAIYTPKGYDPDRAKPYPVLVLSHGGGETEIAWPTRGRIQQILDNLIASKQVQKMVVVMPTGTSPSGDYDSEILDTVLPYVADRYNISTDSSGMAFAGTSAYGTAANNFLFTDTTAFGYVGAWSPANGAPAVTVTGQGTTPVDDAYYNPELLDVLGIHVAIGAQETGGNAPMMTAQAERIGLVTAGVPFTWFTEGGGHTWAFWKDTLRDFLLRVAFRTTTTSVTAGDSSQTASVASATTETKAPTGTVQFYVDGSPVGNAKPLVDGTATLNRAVSGTLTATYSGDTLYNTSTSK